MKKPKKDRYEPDPDGFLREIVGDHARDKQQLLRTYIELSSYARKNYRKNGGRTAYLDLYCGTGRVRFRSSKEVADGCAVLAATTALASAPFDMVVISDMDSGHAHACGSRLSARGVDGVTALVGKADEVVEQAIAQLPRNALTQVLLDPYSLTALSFNTIERLSKLAHVDMVVHFSTYDMNRNLERYLPTGGLEHVAPGATAAIETQLGVDAKRQRFFKHWCAQVEKLGLQVCDIVEKVLGPQNVNYYYLVLLYRHPLADRLWKAAKAAQAQRSFGFS